MPGSHEHDHAPRGGDRIVAGYDGSPSATRALKQAAVDAGPLGRVHVVIAYPDAAHLGAADELLAALRHGAVPALVRTHWHDEVREGPPAEVILSVAREFDAHRIYLGTRGVGRARALLGSVADAVLRMADRPVLVIPQRAVVREREQAEVPV